MHKERERPNARAVAKGPFSARHTQAGDAF